jgi:O-glycosyl hydrolase
VQSSTHIRLPLFLKLQLGGSAMRAHLNRSLFTLTFPLSLLLFEGSAHAISYNIFGDAAPPVPAWSDSNAVEVGVKFIANGSMLVQGVRFYKGSGNTGTHIAHLWNSVGTLLATQNFSNENGSGWQTVLFTLPVRVNAGQIYIASYLAPQGHYAADVNGLVNGKGLITDPVYAPSNCAAGGNGVYRYSEKGGFPSDTYRANNYYVDVIVTPESNPAPPVQCTISGTISPGSYGSGATLHLSDGASMKTTTADAGGNFKFTVPANGSYTVTSSKPGYAFSPASRTVTVNSASVTDVNFTASVAAIANLVVDAASVQQHIDGMGVNINVNSWKNGELKPALDALIDVNGSSAFRVIRDPMTWVGSESLIPALHSLDLPTLQSVYEAPAMQDIWNTIRYLNQKGILGKQIILNFMGWTPTWLGGSGGYGQPSHITAGKERSFATMVASLVYYGHVVKGLNFTYLSPLNEEDGNCKEGPCANPSQYALIMSDLAAELNGMGVTDVRFVAPETAHDPSAYIASISGDSKVFSITDHLTFHAYPGSRRPGTSYAEKNYWVTETGASCPSCDNSGSPSQGEWAFASQTNDAVLDDLADGIASVLIYDGYDSFYYHHNSYGRWGLLAYDQTSGVYSPRKRFYVNSQINRFVTPCSQTLSLTNSVSGLSHVGAFYNRTTRKFAIVGHNTAASPVTVNGQINNLPMAVTSMNVYETNTSVDFQQGAAVPVNGGSFRLTVPADTFFSLSN